MFLRRSAAELPHQSSNTCRFACPLYCRKWKGGESVGSMVWLSHQHQNNSPSAFSTQQQKPTNTHFLQYSATSEQWENCCGHMTCVTEQCYLEQKLRLITILAVHIICIQNFFLLKKICFHEWLSWGLVFNMTPSIKKKPKNVTSFNYLTSTSATSGQRLLKWE